MADIQSPTSVTIGEEIKEEEEEEERKKETG